MKELIKQILTSIEVDKEYNIVINVSKRRVNPLQSTYDVKNLEIKQVNIK